MTAKKTIELKIPTLKCQVNGKMISVWIYREIIRMSKWKSKKSIHAECTDIWDWLSLSSWGRMKDSQGRCAKITLLGESGYVGGTISLYELHYKVTKLGLKSNAQALSCTLGTQSVYSPNSRCFICQSSEMRSIQYLSIRDSKRILHGLTYAGHLNFFSNYQIASAQSTSLFIIIPKVLFNWGLYFVEMTKSTFCNENTFLL